jgi:hypothetical protein
MVVVYNLKLHLVFVAGMLGVRIGYSEDPKEENMVQLIHRSALLSNMSTKISIQKFLT